MVFVALSNGCVQAFNASTLESLWLYADPLGGQPNCPLTVKDGYLYTGFWNSETGDANFVCMTITDEDPGSDREAKCVSWSDTSKGGYYWAGAYVGNGYVLIGTDDGTNLCNSKSSSLLLLDARTGRLLDRLDNLNGDIRSTIVYDGATDSFCFTSKGGSFYCVQVSGSRLTNLWSVALQNGNGGIPMSTCSPVVHNGRAYVGVSGAAQFGAYSGHNIPVVDLGARAVAYRVDTQGYPQTSGLLTTAYAEESGYVYVYFFDNMTPGKLRVLRDRPGMTAPDYTTTEKYGDVAYALFTPTGDQAQYAICSPIVDEYGTVYFKNDSAYLMAFGSAVEKIEITTAPDKTAYMPGESFDPTGMVVTATYANGRTRDITRYVSWNEDGLTVEDAADVGGFNLLQPLADFEQTCFQGINGPIFALLALDCGNYEIPENVTENTQATREMYVDYIINAQLPEGGWALMGGEAEIDLTAMALQALAKYQDRRDVAEATEKGLAILSDRQNENGGHQFNENEQAGCESVAQVMVALAELGIAMDDDRFVKNGKTLLDGLMQFQQAYGGFSHLIGGESDLLATEQAFYAMVAADRIAKGESSLYRMKYLQGKKGVPPAGGLFAAHPCGDEPHVQP